ncbi:hypothetical protein CSKR_104863 [Clonorchis sinensis]|uniref:Uncharacterized protein n=1 Tax=Clonorchis sinensis TaxID=79923 RepID=A0A3R7GID1_CLOSI|nr:hypothetical protein CSKR_104863 [Clonorchis sinensis]
MMSESAENQSFHRMSSQKRRKLWSLAARAAVKCPDDAEKAMIDSPSISVPSKDSLVKTQDSGVSVDLQADPMQVTGAFTTLYVSTNPVSFDKVFHSLDKHTVGQDHPSFRFPSRYSSGAVLNVRDIRCALPKISDPFPRPGDVARFGPRPHRRILNPIRRIAGNRVFDSADSSGIGSSLDWASMDVGQPNPGRHLSATLIPPIFPVNIPISTRSFDESLSQRKDVRPFPKVPDIPVTNFMGTLHPSYHRLGLSMDSSPDFRPEDINPRVQLEAADGRVDPLSGYWYTKNRQSRPFSPVLRRTAPQELVGHGHRMFRSLDQSQVPTEYAPCLTTPRKPYPLFSGPRVDIPLGGRSSMLCNANVAPIQHHAPTYHAKPWWSRVPTASCDTAAPKLCTRYSTGYLFDPINRRSFFNRRSRTLDEASVHHTNTVSDCRLHSKKHVMYPVPPPTDEYDLIRSESPFSHWPEKNRSGSSAFLRAQLSTDRLTFRGLDDRQGLSEFTASGAAPMKLELSGDIHASDSVWRTERKQRDPSSWRYVPSGPQSEAKQKDIKPPKSRVFSASYQPGSKRHFEAIASHTTEGSPPTYRATIQQRVGGYGSTTPRITEESPASNADSSGQQWCFKQKPPAESSSPPSSMVRGSCIRSSSIDRPLIIPDYTSTHVTPSQRFVTRDRTTEPRKPSTRSTFEHTLTSEQESREKLLRSPKRRSGARRGLHSPEDEDRTLSFKAEDEELTRVDLLADDALEKETPTFIEVAPVETYYPSTSSRKGERRSSHGLPSRMTVVNYSQPSIRLTDAEMNEFAEYWDHCVFTKARVVAVCLAGVASVCLICAVGASTWIYQGSGSNITYSGFWKRCNQQNGTCEYTIPFFTQRTGWQDGVLCMLLLAMMLGFLGISLAVAGHLVGTLARRLYYFHSGGESHVVAAFVTALSIMVYHVTMAVHHQHISGPVTFGAAYGVTWFACILHLLSALLLFIDELLHRLAIISAKVKCVRLCLNCLIRFYARIQHLQRERRKRRLAESSGHAGVTR